MRGPGALGAMAMAIVMLYLAGASGAALGAGAVMPGVRFLSLRWRRSGRAAARGDGACL
jgi:hypothetical protein